MRDGFQMISASNSEDAAITDCSVMNKRTCLVDHRDAKMTDITTIIT